MTALRTPASVIVEAVCPTCSQRTPLLVYLNAELVTNDEGSTLAVKAKASKAVHLCGQMSLEDAGDPVHPLADLARETGTSVTVTHQGRSVTFGRLAYTSLVADGETLDEALARAELREDYQDVIGSEPGQALLQAIKDEGGAFVPFLTPEQLAGAS